MASHLNRLAISALLAVVVEGVAAFSLPSLQDLLGSTSALASCAAAPEQWLNPFPSAAVQPQIKEVLNSQHNASLLWGTYRPGFYFGSSSRTTPGVLMTGIMWHRQHEPFQQARHECRQEDGITRYGWTHHDGRGFGRQEILDKKTGALFTTDFVVLGESTTHHWASRIKATPSSAEEMGPLSLYLYIALDCDGAINANDCLSMMRSDGFTSVEIDKSRDKTSVFIHGKMDPFGPFTMEVNAHSPNGSPLDITYWGLENQLVADLKPTLEQKVLVDDKFPPVPEDVARTKRRATVGSNQSPRGSNVVVVRVSGTPPFLVDTLMHRVEKEEDEPDVEGIAGAASVIDKAVDMRLARFKTNFESTFELHQREYKGRRFKEAEVQAAQAALSNMVGGMGHFFGRATVKGKNQQPVESFMSSLFTAVPSRSFFPRGFLWDEGFHHLLIHKWDLGLTYDVVLHWLSNMHQHPKCPSVGWIPRELAIGEQAKRRIPREYLAQDVTVANPPTFLLVFEKILALDKDHKQCTGSSVDDHEGAGAIQRRDAFLRASWPRLEAWVQWLMSSQAGPVPGSFRWRGRNPEEEKLVPNTLSSGLDDYPRASDPSEDEYHVDLACWMIKGCQVLAQIAEILGDKRQHEKYSKAATSFLASLDELHWNETLGGYFDFGKHSGDGFPTSTVVIKCATPDQQQVAAYRIPLFIIQKDQSPCTPDHPLYMGVLRNPEPYYYRNHTHLQHVDHIGYVTLFPVLLGLIPADSPKLGQILQVMRNDSLLWSAYGLRSLSEADMFYNMENAEGDKPYWRGYIWININYLALRALHSYSLQDGPYKQEAAKIYRELRDNLLTNLLGEYERTGYWWEQYDDTNGRGLRSHPFTGWTALVVNIMAEEY